jgi:hypothetical protein
VKPLQKIVEQLIAVAPIDRPSGEGAPKRCGDSGLIGQALDTDDTPFHVKLGRRLLQLGFAGH